MKARLGIALSAMLFAAGSIAACETSEPELAKSAQNHTEDCRGFVTNYGTVPWGSEGLTAKYEHDFETHRFFISVETASDFQIEVTQKGTNRHLDLVMAVYAPNGERVAADDDSGWGRYPRIKLSTETVGMYEVRVDPKYPETDSDSEVEWVRGKYRVELECLSALCDVSGAQALGPADMNGDLETLLDGVENSTPTECDDEGMCTSQSAYGVRYTFNPALPPDQEEAADHIADEEYAYGRVSTSYTKAEFASMLTEFNLTIEQIDNLLGYTDYDVAGLEIDDDCSPDYCEGSWFFLQNNTAGEIHAIRLGYYMYHD